MELTAQARERLLSVPETVGSIPNTIYTKQSSPPVTLALAKQRQENQKFKVILGYTVSSRPAWGT